MSLCLATEKEVINWSSTRYDIHLKILILYVSHYIKIHQLSKWLV